MEPNFNRYTRVAVALHWAIAVLIIYQLAVGLVMEHIADMAVRIPLVELHGSFGMTVLALSLARLAWRLGHAPPPPDPRLHAWERGLSHAVHGALYVMMIAMPLIGWSILSASARALKHGVFLFFSPIRVPPLPLIPPLPPAALSALHDRFVLAHTLGGYLMIALLLAHVAGALKHQWWDRQPSLGRMWFGRDRAN